MEHSLDAHLKVSAQVISATSRVRSMSWSPSSRISGSTMGTYPGRTRMQLGNQCFKKGTGVAYDPSKRWLNKSTSSACTNCAAAVQLAGRTRPAFWAMAA